MNDEPKVETFDPPLHDRMIERVTYKDDIEDLIKAMSGKYECGNCGFQTILVNGFGQAGRCPECRTHDWRHVDE